MSKARCKILLPEIRRNSSLPSLRHTSTKRGQTTEVRIVHEYVYGMKESANRTARKYVIETYHDVTILTFVCAMVILVGVYFVNGKGVGG